MHLDDDYEYFYVEDHNWQKGFHNQDGVYLRTHCPQILFSGSEEEMTDFLGKLFIVGSELQDLACRLVYKDYRNTVLAGFLREYTVLVEVRR